MVARPLGRRSPDRQVHDDGVGARLPYQEAMRATAGVIHTRARWYRNLVAGVAAVLLGSVLAALIAWSLAPLAGLLAVVPLCGAFFVLDGRLVLGWQRKVLSLWAEQDLDLNPLRDALTGMPMLPPRTLGGMLDLLPKARDGTPSEPRSRAARRALAVAAGEIHTAQVVRRLAGAVARLLGFLCIVLAILWRSPAPLLGLLAVPVLLAGPKVHFALRLYAWRREMALLRPAAGGAEAVRKLVMGTDWGDAPSELPRRLSDAVE